MTSRDELPPATEPPVDPAPAAHHGIMARFRNYFLTGLVVAGPIAITFYLTWWFVTWVDGLVRPFVPIAYRPETYLPFGLPGSGLIVAVIALTLLGFLTANLIGRTLVDLGDTQIQALDELSKKEKRSRAALIRQAIDDYLAKRQSKQESNAFGLWGKRKVDGLAYQEKVRREW